MYGEVDDDHVHQPNVQAQATEIDDSRDVRAPLVPIGKGSLYRAKSWFTLQSNNAEFQI